MIVIDNVLVSDNIIEEYFVCDLAKCKGECCVDGDCGAPLTEDETKTLAEIYPLIKSSLCQEYIPEIEKQGTHTTDSEHGLVTPTINGGICVYGYTEDLGIVKCGIEKAWTEGKTTFRKPISCHLYPIRIKETEGFEALNYEPRLDICSPACKNGKKLRVPVHSFLKDAIIRKYGSDFFMVLNAAYLQLKAK